MWYEIIHTLPGPGKVDADFGAFTIHSDHPPTDDREGRPPEPFALFLASIGTCAASFVMAYCQEEGLPYQDIRLIQHQEFSGEGETIPEFSIQIQVPSDFPENHLAALIEAAGECTVKRVMEACPAFRIQAKRGESR